MNRDRYQAWEWDTSDDMQVRLAGEQPRAVYLADREQRAEWIVGRLALSSSSAVLEIGSGEGVVAALLATGIGDLCCADVSKSFLDQAAETCRELANVSFHLIEDDYLAALPSARFDAGYSLNVFIHLDIFEMAFYFRELARLLRPGGRFVFNFLELAGVTWPYFHSELGRYRSAGVVEAKGMMTWHHRETIAALANDAGLVPELDDLLDEGGVVYLTVRRPAATGG